MMPAVNYEPAGVMARIKKLDAGSLFKKEKQKTTTKPHRTHLEDFGGWLKQRRLVLTLQRGSGRDLWTNRSNHIAWLHYNIRVFQILPRWENKK